MTDVKKNSYMEVINLTADDPTLLMQNVEQNEVDGIVKYGINDDQFDYLIRMATYSTTNGALIDAISSMIFGKGLNVQGIMTEDDLRRLCTDFYQFGNAAIQIVNGKLMHVPVNFIRAQEVDEEGIINNYFFNTDWSNDNLEHITIPNWEVEPNAARSIYYLRPYKPNAFYYHLPSYQSCLFYCELEEKVGQYLLNIVDNKFSVLKIINANNGTGDEESRAKFTRQIKEKATGVKGDVVVVAFNEDKEHAITVEDISIDNAAEQYQYISAEAQNKILVGHKLTSPLIVGIRDFATGFGSNAEELQVATSLYVKMQVEPKQAFLANGIGIVVGRDDLAFLNDDLEVAEAEATELALKESENALQEFISLGREELEGYELVHENVVDHETDDKDDYSNESISLAKQALNFVSTGTARPRAKSSQDNEDVIVRYKYTQLGNHKSERDFCKAMISASKIYRKEDIIQLENKSVNPGWGPKGSDQYSVWKFAGGGNCYHKWNRKIFLRKGIDVDPKSPLAETISRSEARRKGIKIEPNNKAGEKGTAAQGVAPINQKNKGFLPSNPQSK